MINFSLKTLPNGIRVITAPLTQSEAVAVLILVGIGGRYESEDKSGISHFLEHVFFKGSKNYPTAQDLAKKLDGLGANYNAFTSEEYTGFYIQSAANDFSSSLNVLSDMFLNPLFPEAEVEREKGVIIEEANMRRDVPQIHVQVLSQEQMFPGSALGRDLIGTPQTVKSISREDISSYFEKGYLPRSMAIVISGNPKDENWLSPTEKIFSSGKEGEPVAYQEYRPEGVREKVVEELRKVDQTHFVLSTLTFPKTDQRRYALSLLAAILAGGMSSRLFSEIRDRRGWAYYVKADLGTYHDTGCLSFSVGVKKDKLEDSVKLILEQIEQIKKDGPQEEELERSKANLRGHLALSLEGSLEVASFLAEELLYEKEIRQPEAIIESLGKVQKEEIRDLTREIFGSGRTGLALISSESKKGKLKELF
ncbi:MAG: insulinase family protein [Candidatus Berkelbacteria bacterium]|nr:insulinase family protein [Candidatus Berkelbacteria bacterium]